MNPATMVLIYVIVWWVVIFAVLPWRVRSSAEEGEALKPGQDPGAPAKPYLALKFLVTSVVSAGIVAAIWAAERFGLTPEF